MCDEVRSVCDEVRSVCDEVRSLCDEVRSLCDEVRSLCDEVISVYVEVRSDEVCIVGVRLLLRLLTDDHCFCIPLKACYLLCALCIVGSSVPHPYHETDPERSERKRGI